MKKIFFLFITIITLYSCEKPCEASSPPPLQIPIELIDLTTFENVFTNGTYNQSQIHVVDENGTPFQYYFSSENNNNVISIAPNWGNGSKTLFIKLNNSKTINIIINTEIHQSRCDSVLVLKSFLVVGNTFTINKKGFYVIKI